MKQLTKEEALKAFIEQQEAQLAQMDDMVKNQNQLQRMMMNGNATEEQQKEAMFIIVLEQCRSVDKTFEKTGIDEETLQAAMEKHKL